jgi:hypothetical protein
MANLLHVFLLLLLSVPSSCFTSSEGANKQRINAAKLYSFISTDGDSACMTSSISRRGIIDAAMISTIVSWNSFPAWAASREPLADLLYRIIRVREATIMETRLIKNGKFKDAQRANIKLAVRFMVENYRLNDAFVAASTYLDGANRRLEASQLGQSATQNLVTILEYFDAGDVQNLKVINRFCSISLP